MNLTPWDVLCVGFIATVAGWVTKELWYTQKGKLEKKVDKDICDKEHKHLNDDIKYIRDRVDAIFDKIHSGGK